MREHVSHVGVYDCRARCLVSLPWRGSYYIGVDNVTNFLGRLLATEVHLDLFARLFSPVNVLKALSCGHRRRCGYILLVFEARACHQFSCRGSFFV